MKAWKSKKKTCDDYYDRDFPCMILNGTFYIGNRGSSHATMVQEVLCGMNFLEDYQNLYSDKWNDEDCNEILFFRDDGEDMFNDYDEYCFGEIKGKDVFWDFWEMKHDEKKNFINIIKNACKNSKYKHYYSGDKAYIKIKL